MFLKNLQWLHTWSGLSAGLVVLFLALTGGALVLKPSLQPVVYGDLHRVPACTAPLPLDSLVAQAQQAHPQSRVDSVDLQRLSTASVAVKFDNKDYLYLDPCSGKVLGQQAMYGGWFGMAEWLHRLYFLPDRKLGRTVVGWVDVVFLTLLVLGGLVLWWPRQGQPWRAALRLNPRQPGAARTLNLHRVTGAYTALVLVVVTVCALPLAFDTVKQWIYSAAGDVSPPKSAAAEPPEGGTRQSLQQFWLATQQVFPTLSSAQLRLPRREDAPFEAQVLTAERPHDQAKSYFDMDAYSGQTLRLVRYDSDQQLGRKVYLYALALHTGAIMGWPYQLLLALAMVGVGVQAYTGLSSYVQRQLRARLSRGLRLKVVSKTMLTPDVALLELAHPRGRALPAFGAGAHIDLVLGEGLTRSYSLCGDPAHTRGYAIAVQLHPDSRGGSRQVHQGLQVGDAVHTSLPKNHFALAPVTGPVVLVAGGIGITPILAMAHQLHRDGADFELHYCVRSAADAAFLASIWTAPFAQHMRLHASEGQAHRRMDADAVLAAPAKGAQLYVCGPQALMDAVLAAARRQGWPEDALHREHFSGAQFSAEHNRAFEIRVARSGRVVPVAPDQTAVQALRACGIGVPTSCGEGVCGSCMTTVLDGAVEHRDRFLSDRERQRNDRFLPCCSRAAGGTLVLDL